MLPQWTVPTNFTLATVQDREVVDITLPLASTDGITTRVISGTLPAGVRLENNKIVGRCFEVARTTNFTFVIRATSTEGLLDRTFNIIVEGPDNPQWITPEGSLPIGPNNTFYILDSSIIDFQLVASDVDLPAGDTLEYYIADGDGELPPGIRLTTDGRLVGIVDPLLALDINSENGGYDTAVYSVYPFDFSVVSDSGLDTFFYDTTTYDYSIPTRTPKKLNRTYEFVVTVADNVSFSKRRFRIYVVGDDFVRADNTIVKAANGVFTADSTYARAPIWLTPSNLGFRRANNYLTVYLETLDPTNVLGKIQYTLEAINDDGTISVLPPGLELDRDTGELAGRISYLPAITKEYKFTVTASRFNIENGLVTVFGTYSRDVLSGNNTIEIAKLPRTLTDGLDDLQSLVGKEISIEGRNYIVESVDGTPERTDLITLETALQPTPFATPLNVVKEATGTNYFFVTTLSENDKSFYIGKSLNYSSTEGYEIQNIYPYIEYRITHGDSSGGIDLVTEITGPILTTIDDCLENFLSVNEYPAYVSSITGPSGVNEISLIIPATAQNRNINFIKSLFAPTDSGNITLEVLSQFDRIQLDATLTRVFSVNRQISLGVYVGAAFNKTFPRAEVEVTSKTKTFTLTLLGEIESTITWLTDSDLGTLNANRTSTLSVRAVTTVPDTNVKYNVVAGKLPPGLVLTSEGEIVGSVPVNGTPGVPGLTFFDTGTTTFDGAETSLDRVYHFTVLARDRFGFSATTKEFVLKISDLDNLTYSNIFMQPFLKPSQREQFQALINDSKVINPRMVYRPSDPSFGIQRNLRALVYGGIETSNIDAYVAATAKNHKRKRFILGDVKTAVAKNSGSNDIVYEVVYVEIIDPAKPQSRKTRKSFQILNNKKITVDSIKYESQDDTFASLDTSPNRYRPETNTVTADLNAVKVSQSNDVIRYISNIDNMRDNIKAIGETSRDFLPLWMRTAQADSLTELGYVLALPLVYTKPGFGETVRKSVLEYFQVHNFNFSMIDYEIDRYIVDTTTGRSAEEYILFANYQFNV